MTSQSDRQLQKFENAKAAAWKEHEAEAQEREAKTARLRAQRLAANGLQGHEPDQPSAKTSTTSPPGAEASAEAPPLNSEQQIRERAYHLWEADGRPEGRPDEYWYRACNE